MSDFIRVLCRSDSALPYEVIEQFIIDGVYFDPPPAFIRTPPSASSADPDWHRVEVRYADLRRPVLIHNTAPGELMTAELQEARDAASELDPGPAEAVRRHLAGVRRVMAFEVDPMSMSDEAWEMLDALESFIASRHDGIVWAAEGFYDASLKPIR
jgi:hypothetical protein